jgi:MtrB/PioB family decaheme-associated outer membrane protein
MSNTKHAFALSTLAAALMAIYGSAMAAEEPDLKAITSPESWVSIGVGGLFGDERRQFGIVGGVRDTGGYLLLDADINQRDDATGTWKTLQASNVGMNSREVRAEFQQQGNQGVVLEYRQSKREVPYIVNTYVTGIGTANQTVPSAPTFCTSPGVPSGCITPGAGTNYQLGTERSKYGIEYFKYFSHNFKFKVAASNEDKDGDRIGRVGGQPEFAAIPVDWHVRKLDATLDYVGEKFQWSGGYNGSWFVNDNDLLTATRGATSYYISQPLDSMAHRFFVDGGYTFTPTTRGTFKLSYTHATQDEHIPTADIAGLTWAGDATYPAAPTHLDGEINTTQLELGLTSRPTSKLNVVANIRYHKVDDETPTQLVINTIGNAAGGYARTLVDTTPLSYETLTGKLEATYRLPDNYSLIGGIDYSSQDRTVPYGSDVAGGAVTPTNGDDQPDGLDDQRYVPWRAELEELTYRVQLRRSMSDTLNGALAFLHSKRDGSAYVEAAHSEPGEGVHPDAIDPINIADRERNKLRLTMDWMPTDALNLQANYENARDKYSGHTYGLRDGKAWLFSLDASYAINKDWQVTAWYSHDYTEANQLGWREGTGSQSELDKVADLKDTGNSLGLGLKGLISQKLKVGADLQWTRIRSEYDETLTDTDAGSGVIYLATTGGPLPDIKSTVTRFKLFAEYALRKNADIRVDLVHERWKTDDWTWQFADGTSFIFNDGTMVLTEPKQTSTFLGMRYKYKF